MKMKKLMTLGVIAPIFALTTSCSNGIKKIGFDEAFNFAIKNYDQYYHLGYEPNYILKVNEFSIQDTKVYQQLVKDDSRSYEQVYYIDTTIKDFATTIDTDEIPTLHVNSLVVRKAAEIISVTNALLGYFDSFFTLENGKYLGVYVGSNELGQVINIAGGVLALLGIIKSGGGGGSMAVDYFELLTSSNASLKLTASCNNLGLFDRAHLYLGIDNLSAVPGSALIKLMDISKKSYYTITSKHIALDIDFIVDYSSK